MRTAEVSSAVVTRPNYGTLPIAGQSDITCGAYLVPDAGNCALWHALQVLGLVLIVAINPDLGLRTVGLGLDWFCILGCSLE
jgi:hypothetical protein